MRVFVKSICILSVLSVVTLAEQSVYGANNGFYQSEKEISKNKKTITYLQQKIQQQNERINGLMSVVEGLSVTVNELKNTTHTPKTDTSNSDRALLQELGKMIDKINADYVSKETFRKAMKAQPTKSVSRQTTTKENTITKPASSLAGMSLKSLYSEGVRLFVKQRFDEAKKRFDITDTKGYKPAASNYYLGEIAYYTKKYEDAIFYFKKSAGLYDKASYIDTLLLHTAIALDKNGEKKQARAFYENIVENYAGRKTASIAKERLKKL